ncbi:MAG: PKD domain-containing protein [Bacteroidia bacterium]|nr:PKD domain-containing protein [Bacteroidia bacterium]
MKSILSLLIVLFSMTGLFAQNVCTVKVLFAVNKTNPPSYTFKTDPQTTSAKYSWAFGDETFSDSPTPTHTYSKGGSYLIHVKVTTGTGAAATTCYGELSAQFEGSTVTHVVPCKVTILASKNSTNSLSYSFKTDPASTASTARYLWTFGDGTPNSDTKLPSHTFAKEGTYMLHVTVTNGTGADAQVCYGELGLKVEAPAVTPPVVACTVKIVITRNSTTPASYTFKTDPQTAGARYSWTFGDNTVSDSPMPTHTFSKGGSYVLHVQVKSGTDASPVTCNGELSAQFDGGTVTPPVPCKVTILAAKNSTNPLIYSFKTDPASTSTSARYLWTFGDETPNSDTKLPSHTFAKAGTYVLHVTVTNGTGADAQVCYGELSLKVEAATVTPVVPCKVTILASKNSTNPLSYSFKTDPASTASKFIWNFGDGTNNSDTQLPAHNFSKAGTYVIHVYVTTGTGQDAKICYGEMSIVVEGTAVVPPATVTYSGRGKVSSLSSVTGCSLVITTMENMRLIPAKISANFVLREGQYVEFTYQKYAEKITTCKEGADINIITIKEISATTLPNCKGPINLLLFDPTNNLCNGSATVKLLDEAGKEIPNVKYLWSDGRTGSSAGTLCPGKLYTVQATIENVCQKTTSFTLLSKPLWHSSSVDGVNNFTVLAPVDGVQYEWNFGNGITKIGPSVSYNFQKDGIYDVQLKAVGLNGVSESTKQVVVMKSVATTDVINKSEVDLYPNPAKEIIRVDFKNPAEGTLKVEIKNLSGRSVYIEQITNDGSSHADINIQNLNAGMYVLRISNDQRIIGEKKFIKTN